MSSESARPEDVREVAALLPELPPESTTRELDARGYLQIQVIGGDGQVKTYRRAADSPFSHSVLQRLETIMRSYRAGYW